MESKPRTQFAISVFIGHACWTLSPTGSTQQSLRDGFSVFSIAIRYAISPLPGRIVWLLAETQGRPSVERARVHRDVGCRQACPRVAQPLLGARSAKAPMKLNPDE